MGEKKQRMAKPDKKKRKPLPSKTLTKDSKKQKMKNSDRKRKQGPHLRSAQLEELGLNNPNRGSDDSDSDAYGGDHHLHDLYEYEEPLPEEESKKNRRYDPVDNYEYDLPEDFKDEDIPSDDEDDDVDNGEDDDEEDNNDDDERHLRMLKGVTGMPGEAFQGKKKKKVVFLDNEGTGEPATKLTLNDFIDGLHGTTGYNELRNRLQTLEKQSLAVHPPLPKVEQERIERKVAYQKSKEEITKWEPLVKKNREAPTLYFQEDVDVGFSTVGAIALGFKPRTEFEKKMAELVNDHDVFEAHSKDGDRLLEYNKISVKDVKDRHNRLAKMRSLLFKHEIKLKHIKKIKSKAYRRIMKKEKSKGNSAEMEMDPEAAKEHAMKQEFKRAEERMTLKHKNTSKWAKRVLQRGLHVQDESTRASISEQLQQHTLLTRKMNSMKDDDSSDDDSSDEDVDEEPAPEEVSKILNKAKMRTTQIIEEDDEMPNSGVLALPFMVNGLKKRKEAAYEEARSTLQEYDSSLGLLEDHNGTEQPTSGLSSGRKTFGPERKKSKKSNVRRKPETTDNDSESEDEVDMKEDEELNITDPPEIDIVNALRDEADMGQETVFRSFNDTAKDPGPKTTYEVAIFASDSWRKMKGENAVDESTNKTKEVKNPNLSSPKVKEMDQNSDSESDGEMVDGFLSSGANLNYELPSQTDLIHRAFAGDDVEAEFDKDKMETLNEENPEPEKPVMLPGWGQWTHVQQKKGLPSWMLKEHEQAQRKREEALKKRKDAHLKHVIISEKIDKKAEKLHAKALPFPYTSKDVYEGSIRMPIGPEYNPAISVGALIRPAIVKKAGTIIKPIKFKEVDPHKKGTETKQNGQKSKAKKPKIAGGKTTEKPSGLRT